MPQFEYKVIPAPKRGLKAKGVKGAEARFANALQVVMNEQGAEGWEYQRTDTLPSEERQGLTGRVTVFQNMLVFRRELAEEVADAVEAPALIEDQTEALAEEQAPEAQEQTAEERVQETLETAEAEAEAEMPDTANSDDSPRTTHAAE